MQSATHLALLSLALSSLISGACGEGSGTDKDGSQATDAGSVERCTPLAFSKNLPLEGGADLVDVLPYAGGALALVSGDAFGLQLVTEDLDVIPLDSEKPRNADLSRASDGTVCATWALDIEGPLHRACSPEFAVIEHGGLIEVNSTLHVSESASSGPMAFFRGDFSSASAATLINGEWTEEQLFESSISSFGDATSHQGLAYACLLTSADHAAIMSETDLGAGFSSIDRVVTDSTASIQNCRMDTAGNELSAVFVDSNEELFRGTGTLGSTGLDPQSWSSESVASGLNRRFDYAATEGAYAIVYRNDDTGENLVHWNRSGTVESQVLLEGANMGYPMAFFDEGGSLYVATTGSVDGESGLGFYRICAE